MLDAQAGLVVEFAGGVAERGCADDPVAGCLPRGDGGCDGGGLAGAGAADHGLELVPEVVMARTMAAWSAPRSTAGGGDGVLDGDRVDSGSGAVAAVVVELDDAFLDGAACAGWCSAVRSGPTTRCGCCRWFRVGWCR